MRSCNASPATWPMLSLRLSPFQQKLIPSMLIILLDSRTWNIDATKFCRRGEVRHWKWVIFGNGIGINFCKISFFSFFRRKNRRNRRNFVLLIFIWQGKFLEWVFNFGNGMLVLRNYRFFFFFSRNRRNFVNVVRLKFFEPKIGNFGIEWILIFVKLPAFFSSKWCNWRNFVNITWQEKFFHWK